MYVGELIGTGTPVWQSVGSMAAPNVQPFFRRANPTLVESLKSALKF